MAAAMRLTTKDVEDAFGVTPMTVYNWRKGTPTREPLPAEVEGRRVFYRAARLKAWAKRHGIPLLKDPEAVSAHSKPGPKTAPKGEPG
ncbi:hypothetical protein D3C87_848000 [compost metagenome]